MEALEIVLFKKKKSATQWSALRIDLRPTVHQTEFILFDIYIYIYICLFVCIYIYIYIYIYI